MTLQKILIFCLLFIVLLPLSYAANEEYKPYLHKPSIPEHPKVKLYGKYQTNIFPGAGTYTYELEVPKGTNNLQPSLSISYNSQSAKQRPSFLGAGWQLTQNYILRDVNFTPSNASDDEFKLILNNANYDLIYNTDENLFHTETETFLRIENLSNSTNTNAMYWLLTLKDGTKLRFGYNNDSELDSNLYSYVSKWHLDLIEDLHGNKIFYSYNENPFSQDNGTAYLNEISYNNEQKRKIQFSYENTTRPDRRLVYEQGNKVEESRRLTDISVLFNDSLVRRYSFEFKNLSLALSSLSKIKYIGSDNSSLLHQITFAYHEPTYFYHNSTFYNITESFSNTEGNDTGVRFVDLNRDGFIDILQGKDVGDVEQTWLNNKTGWNLSSDFLVPEHFVDFGGNDKGLRTADLNNDGFQDLIYGRNGVRKAWLNTGSGFIEDSLTWAPPIDFVALGSGKLIDNGLILVDFNGDGKVDILQSKWDIGKKAYINTGSGWKNVSSIWKLPDYLVGTDGDDRGLRLDDLNGDGLIDVIHGLYTFNDPNLDKYLSAWLNNGNGWTNASHFAPPTYFVSNSRPDEGLRLVDINLDGLPDILEDYENGTVTENSAYINNGYNWTLNNSFQSPEPFTRNGRNIGRRISDVNADSLPDLVVSFNDNDGPVRKVIERNKTIPYLLKNITNEFGGITSINYEKSTIFNNTDDDGISDLGFNIWVVKEVLQDNGIKENISSFSLPKFNVIGNTSYIYFNGKYDFNNSEFRGFAIVNETLSDNSTIVHYFHQDDELKGKEFKTEVFDKNRNIFTKTENNYNITTINNPKGNYFVVHFDSSASYLYEGSLDNPKIVNVSFRYDNYSNIIEKTNFGNVNISEDEKYEIYEFVYNTTAWIIDKISKYILFDKDNKTILRQNKYFYDNHELGVPPSKGDLTKSEQYLDTGGGNPTTTYTYDSFGNLYQQTDALGRTTTTDYGIREDTNTYPDRITNELGHAIDYTYDVSNGNIISYIKNGIEFLYEYDTFGRIVKDIDPYDTSDFPTKKYSYDFDGTAPEITKVSQKTTSNNTIDIFYYYDGFGNLIQIKTPSDNGQQIIKNLFYDGLFRLKEEQNPYFANYSSQLSDVSNITNTTKYNYDVLGRITSILNSDGTTKNTSYNHWEINDYDENGNRHTYLLDAYDRILSVTEYLTDYYIGDNLTFNTSYIYNGADELTGIKDTYGNYFNFTYDSLGRKIKLIDPDLGIWSYQYDLAGNLISQTGGGGNLQTGDSYYREYNGLGQLKSVKEGNNSNSRILEEYFYDSNGDRIKINRYSYSGGTNETIYTPYKEWMQIRNSSGIFNFYYIYQDNVLVARLNPDGTKYFYHADHLGSTNLITDEQGNIVEQEFYSPFGESLSANKEEEFKLYTGQFKDTVGQYYYKSRYYKPDWTRFNECDKIKFNVYDPQALNCYSYGLNNPYLFIDPDGKNARVYLDRDAHNVGHIAIGVDDPNFKGGEIIFENVGIGTNIQFYTPDGIIDTRNDNDRKALSFSGTFDAITYGYSKQVKDEQGKIKLPEDYDDYFEIEQDEILDKLMMDKGNELNNNPWKYNAIGRNSMHYSNTILKAGGYSLKYTLTQIPNIAFLRSQPSEGKTVQGGGYVTGIGYITKDGIIYPTNNPKWKPNPNAPRYKPPQSKKS